jgi:hypothetical protein
MDEIFAQIYPAQDARPEITNQTSEIRAGRLVTL